MTVAQGQAPAGGSNSGSPAPQKSSLYEDHSKVYVREITGTFRTIKWWFMGILFAIFYLTPWLRWDRGEGAPEQAIILDVPTRKFYLFNFEIWPQEIYYLTGILVVSAIGLFFVTSLVGRVWCGFACIQTVYTDAFVAIERWIEGGRTKRIRLDKEPMTAAKAWKKSLKYTLWMLLSLVTAYGFLMYFYDAPTETWNILTLQASSFTYGFIAIGGVLTFLLAGFAREQVCIYMCPWPRFQSAMLDEDSMIVTYEAWRGEPRMPVKGGQRQEGAGDCVDCGLCVQVCPTGTDIRKGVQLSCIGCGLCIDACNGIMKRFGREGYLINYDSESRQLHKARGENPKINFLRPRTLLYFAALLIISTVMITHMATRSRLEVNVMHGRQPLFVRLSDGSIRNDYEFKILNMEPKSNTFELRLEGVEGASMRVTGHQDAWVDRVTLPVAGNTVGEFRIFVKVPRENIKSRSSELEFVLVNVATGEEVDYDTLFAAP